MAAYHQGAHKQAWSANGTGTQTTAVSVSSANNIIEKVKSLLKDADEQIARFADYLSKEQVEEIVKQQTQEATDKLSKAYEKRQSNLERKIRELEREKSQLQQYQVNCVQLSGSTDHMKQENERLQRDKNKLAEDYAALQRELSKTRRELQAEKDNFTSSERRMEHEKQTLTHENSTLSADLSRTREDLRVEKERNQYSQSAEVQMSGTMESLHHEKTQLTENRAALERELSRAQEELKAEREMRHGSETQLSLTEKRLEREKQKLKGENNVLSVDLHNALEDLKAEREKNRFRQETDQMEGLQREKVKLETEMRSLRDDLSKASEALRVEKQKNQQDQSSTSQMSRMIERLKQDRMKLEEDMTKTKEELNSTKTRLSEMMGGQLTDNNPNIADLSDMNRPTKLGERYNELYDNQWTEAFEYIEKENGEKHTIITLKDILLETYNYCTELAQKQMRMLQSEVFFNKQMGSSPTSKHINKLLKDCRKAAAHIALDNIFKTYMTELRRKSMPYLLRSSKLDPFRRECFEICWLMAVQDPPVVLGEEARFLDKFDNNLYRAYTQSGSQVDYVVWPPLYLNEGGQVLTKGVAQGYKTEPRRAKSAKPRRSSSPEAMPSAASSGSAPVAKQSSSMTTYNTKGVEGPDVNRSRLQQGVAETEVDMTKWQLQESNYHQETVPPSNTMPDQYTTPTYRYPTDYELQTFQYYEKLAGPGGAKQFLSLEAYYACVQYTLGSSFRYSATAGR